MRVRDNVESIAFYGGEGHEAATIKVRILLTWTLIYHLFSFFIFPSTKL